MQTSSNRPGGNAVDLLLRQSRLIICVGAITVAFNAVSRELPRVQRKEITQLNQGWSEREIEFYNHATEGTNLAPLDFFLNLPDPAKQGSRFLERLTRDYGFIPAEKSGLNPHGLPVGFAIDERPKSFGDPVYVGLTCSACHTRQLTYTTTESHGSRTSWVVPVHGGPGLVDMQRFKQDLYDTFFALLDNDSLARTFAQGVLGRSPAKEDISALRDQIREFTAPVVVTRSFLKDAGVPKADFGPGNLNALSQGNYNNVGLAGWLTKKGLLPPSGEAPLRPRFEGTNNLPPMWFAPADTWAQYFVEIHHPSVRNWVQSVSTSEVRPPKMIQAMGGGVVPGSIHFDNIAQIQHSLEALRTPKWPEHVFGRLDRTLVEKGRVLYEQHCASCHTRTVLPPNNLGVVFKARPAFDVGTDPTAYTQFAESAAKRVEGLMGLSGKIINFRQKQLEKDHSPEEVASYMNMYSKGRPNAFALAKDQYTGATEAGWKKSGAPCWASPLEGIFATSPYLHNGSVRTLQDLLTPPEQRPKSFRTGSFEFDAKTVGLKNAGTFVFDTTEPGKSNGGHIFGTDLPQDQKSALLEYLKSI